MNLKLIYKFQCKFTFTGLVNYVDRVGVRRRERVTEGVTDGGLGGGRGERGR